MMGKSLISNSEKIGYPLIFGGKMQTIATDIDLENQRNNLLTRVKKHKSIKIGRITENTDHSTYCDGDDGLTIPDFRKVLTK